MRTDGCRYEQQLAVRRWSYNIPLLLLILTVNKASAQCDDETCKMNNTSRLVWTLLAVLFLVNLLLCIFLGCTWCHLISKMSSLRRRFLRKVKPVVRNHCYANSNAEEWKLHNAEGSVTASKLSPYSPKLCEECPVFTNEVRPPSTDRGSQSSSSKRQSSTPQSRDSPVMIPMNCPDRNVAMDRSPSHPNMLLQSSSKPIPLSGIALRSFRAQVLSASAIDVSKPYSTGARAYSESDNPYACIADALPIDHELTTSTIVTKPTIVKKAIPPVELNSKAATKRDTAIYSTPVQLGVKNMKRLRPHSGTYSLPRAKDDSELYSKSTSGLADHDYATLSSGCSSSSVTSSKGQHTRPASAYYNNPI